MPTRELAQENDYPARARLPALYYYFDDVTSMSSRRMASVRLAGELITVVVPNRPAGSSRPSHGDKQKKSLSFDKYRLHLRMHSYSTLDDCAFTFGVTLTSHCQTMTCYARTHRLGFLKQLVKLMVLSLVGRSESALRARKIPEAHAKEAARV